MSGVGNGFYTHLVASNPVLNPIGWTQHMANPNAEITKFDSYLVQMAKDGENKYNSTHKNFSDLSVEERKKYIQAHGGGLVMNSKPNNNNNNNNILSQYMLANPYLNPVGWTQHMVNPNAEITKLDNPYVAQVAKNVNYYA